MKDYQISNGGITGKNQGSIEGSREYDSYDYCSKVPGLAIPQATSDYKTKSSKYILNC